jgi:hypothetical protein
MIRDLPFLLILVVSVVSLSCDSPNGPQEGDLIYYTARVVYEIDSTHAAPMEIISYVTSRISDTVEIVDCGGWQVLQKYADGKWVNVYPGPPDCLVGSVMVYPGQTVNGTWNVYYDSPVPTGLYRFSTTYYRGQEPQWKVAYSSSFRIVR